MSRLAYYLVWALAAFAAARLASESDAHGSLSDIKGAPGLPLVVLFSFTVLRKSRFNVDKGVLSGPEGPVLKPRWEGWFGDRDAMAARS